uniref:AlNc14C114G6461 protein n=1 Tax=Albugo laibachii Nc14 TaxID=890382 RepID=F0WIS6_9STRA|nr:AlNc14C114G6461 [Albugo laibachii Nc14]|eukprot:CCA21170.1 AlNc14C114G6461 [Albugo laibachii Nc14]
MSAPDAVFFAIGEMELSLRSLYIAHFVYSSDRVDWYKNLIERSTTMSLLRKCFSLQTASKRTRANISSAVTVTCQFAFSHRLDGQF